MILQVSHVVSHDKLLSVQQPPTNVSDSSSSPGRNMNSCQLTKSVRQARRSWHRFWTDSGTFTSFMLDPFSLSWLSMLFSHVVLGLPRGLVPVIL